MKISRDDKEFLLCFFAGQAMQGMLVGANLAHTDISVVAADAVTAAKALTKELEAE